MYGSLGRDKKGIWIFIGLVVFWVALSGAYLYRRSVPHTYRILAMMPSYQRPIFLSGQILRFMNQTYPHVMTSVSVKGIPADLFEMMRQKEWQKFIDDGWLRILLDSNKDQFSNMLDTVRNIDLSQYDYFCKVDDDLMYKRYSNEDSLLHQFALAIGREQYRNDRSLSLDISIRGFLDKSIK